MVTVWELVAKQHQKKKKKKKKTKKKQTKRKKKIVPKEWGEEVENIN